MSVFGGIADIMVQGPDVCWCTLRTGGDNELVKRYARSRLYDTQAARYVTIADLRSWAAKGIQFAVVDAETGDDITQVLLA